MVLKFWGFSGNVVATLFTSSTPSMDSSSSDRIALDPSKCSNLSIEEKREVVYELSSWSQGAHEMLQSWSRQEILQILCAEMGKERKYTGLTKMKIIENLLKIVSEKKSLEDTTSDHEPQRTSKRQRKSDHPNRLPVAATNTSASALGNSLYCKNSACRAKLSQDCPFCKRCSCCICYQYDDNKDPSLWLTCNSEPPFQDEACGLSCHLECALKHERSGIEKEGRLERLDGSFYCVSCGKVNDLLGCLRKQLMTAKDTRRVDILCYRISLSQRLIAGTKQYQKVYEIVDKAVTKLEAELGPATGLPVKMARGIVNRLSCGPEVQKLCAFALESLESMCSKTVIQDIIKFEDVCSSSLTVILSSEDPLLENVGYHLWHRNACVLDYPADATCTLSAPNTRFSLSGLTPDTEYHFKVVPFGSNKILEVLGEARVQTGSSSDEVSNPKSLEVVDRSQSPATNCSSLSNPSSVEDESNNIAPCSNEDRNRVDNYLAYCKNTDNIVSETPTDIVIDCTGTALGGNVVDSAHLADEEHALQKTNSTISDTLNPEPKQSLLEGQTNETSTDIGSDTAVQTGLDSVPYMGSSETGLPITPCKLEKFKDGPGRSGRPKPGNKEDIVDNGSGKEDEPQAGSSSKKRNVDRRDEECAGNGDRDLEYYVKVIRWLECEGHMETTFRQKFLTWYSLRATPQEVRVVKVFVDTLIEDPESLAGQLIDTFSDAVSSKRASVVPTGFCLKLWH